MVASILLVLFNGIGAFLERPFDTRRFIASYISVSILTSGSSLSNEGTNMTNSGRFLFSYCCSWATKFASMDSSFLIGVQNGRMT